jgi:hypothetical protein
LINEINLKTSYNGLCIFRYCRSKYPQGGDRKSLFAVSTLQIDGRMVAGFRDLEGIVIVIKL